MMFSSPLYFADTLKKVKKAKKLAPNDRGGILQGNPNHKNIDNPAEVFLQHPLYFVTGESWSLGRSDEEMVHAVLQGGVRIIQLRDKESDSTRRREKAFFLRGLTESCGALFLINDDPALAAEVSADGVHLGQEDMPIAEARSLAVQANRNFFIGLSTHNQKEVEAALITSGDARPDYINLGPLFATATKENQYPPLVGNDLIEDTTGHEQSNLQLNELKNLIKIITDYNEKKSMNPPMLFSVMGGIKSHHLSILSSIGVRTFAMVTELTQHPNPKRHVENLAAMI